MNIRTQKLLILAILALVLGGGDGGGGSHDGLRSLLRM